MKTETEIHARALRLLLGREHSRKELGVKLVAKGGDEEHVELVLNRLEQQQYLCDERFAQVFLRARIERGQGVVRIRRELQEKGVAGALVAELLEDCHADWFELAAQVRARRFGAALPVDIKEQARQHRFLLYRGFTHEQSRKTLRADSEC